MTRTPDARLYQGQLAAGRWGLGIEVAGEDPETLRDLGVAATPDDFFSHLASGAAVAEQMALRDPYAGATGKALFSLVLARLVEEQAARP